MCRERLALELIPSALVCDGTPTLVCGGTLAQDVSLRWPIEQLVPCTTSSPLAFPSGSGLTFSKVLDSWTPNSSAQGSELMASHSMPSVAQSHGDTSGPLAGTEDEGKRIVAQSSTVEGGKRGHMGRSDSALQISP